MNKSIWMWLVFMLAIIPFSTHCQQLHTHYRGKVLDEKTLQPIGYAAVQYMPASKSIITSITDSYGNFQIQVPGDTATLYVTCIGYKAARLRVSKVNTKLFITLEKGAIDLKEVMIFRSMTNTSFHTLSTIDLNLRIVNSSQDLMRLVPGLFLAQHMGGGKAEQIFFRGFDADHGTDLNVSLDGMPVNMVSHIHGQGYADLHFVIPETVANFDFGKGPYYSNKGDFTTAGYLDYTTRDALDKSVISAEGGQFSSYRVMTMIDLLGQEAKRKGTNAYLASEYNYTDGPFQRAERYKRFNLFGKLSTRIGRDTKLSFEASTFSTTWRALGEIPERAVAPGTTAVDSTGKPVRLPGYKHLISRFGTIDSAQGGKSTRINLILRLNSALNSAYTLSNTFYYTQYDFLLHYNSTFLAFDSIHGGEREQKESRKLFGYTGELSRKVVWQNASLTSTLGLATRFDRSFGARSAVTERYAFLQDIVRGNIRQNNSSAYLDESLQLGRWLINGGARLDYFQFGFHDSTQGKTIVSPKLNIQYTASRTLQVYLKSGKGFHSNSSITVIGKGFETLPAAYGADLGFNWKPFPSLYINASLWYLYLQQEFVYSEDGTIVPGGKTKREGIDLSARYQVAKGLFASVNVNLARPRLADSARNTGYLALAPAFTSTGAIDFRLENGINGGISYRYIHSRPGNNTNALVADGYFVSDLKLNYTRKHYELGLSIENLFNVKWNEFEAEEISRLRGEAAPVDQMSFTAGIPFFAKLRLAVFF